MRHKTTLIVLFAILALGFGTALADCGKKTTQTGTLDSVDGKDDAVVLVVEDGKKVTLTMTEKTQVKNADGKKVDVSKLVGEKVKVVSEHSKIDSIEQVA